MTTDRASESVLVLGGGIAGLQAAVDIAELGFHVHLVERGPSIGGRMAQLDKTFPTNDCSLCILAPKMIECASHPRITLHTLAELVRFEGELGRFKAVVSARSRYVDPVKCTGCGDCGPVCPVELPSEFELGQATKKAISKPFPQAVPNVFAIAKNGWAPCRDSCPAGINAQGYAQLVRLGKFDQALATVQEKMPFAGTIGRICHRPCEVACSRREVEQPLALAALKRAAADHGRAEPEFLVPEEIRLARSDSPVAVVGAGPAGLTAAYHLARWGYPVTVLEKLPVAGGMLRVGVPAYRLPREVLAQEIALVEKLGVEIRTSSPVDGEKGVDELLSQGFAAVFIATGAHASVELRLPGEQLRGVIPAVDLLQRIALGRRLEIGKRAVVVGGGNAAVDAARSALRLGAKQVTILYRRGREQMPALSWEIDAALAEGVRLETLAAPIRIKGRAGRVAALEALRMRLAGSDDSGRPRPVPLEGSEFVWECDTVIPAIGQKPQPWPAYPLPRNQIQVKGQGLFVVEPESWATTRTGVFAGGDAVSGPATAIEAVAAGSDAAESIHRYLQDRHLRAVSAPNQVVARPGATELCRVEKSERLTMAERAAPRRVRSFAEVERGYNREQAMAEAARCLNCASCCECRECERACQADAVDHGRPDQLIELQVGGCVVATGFDPSETAALEEYGGGRIANAISGLEFERLLSASGPTGGQVLRPSDSGHPQRIAFIQCAGSRDVRHQSYCSAVCCMHATKEAILAREHDPRVESTVFYMDLRATGKGFQEYVERAQKDYGVRYLRARPARLEEDEKSGDVLVVYEDTKTRKRRVEPFELVVLCQALVPSAGALELARVLGVDLDAHGFFAAPDPLAAPFDTGVAGVLVAGCAGGPQDIPESVVQASAAAGRIAELLGPKKRHGHG